MKTTARFRIVLLLLAFALFFTGASVAGTNVRVMTYNVDEGTDFGPIISVLLNGGNLETAVGQTVDEVVASNPVLRMQLIAQEIAAAQPALVGLQEAALWTSPSIPNGGTLDFLQIILLALQGTYTQIETVDEFHIALTLSTGTVSFTDRDVILVRSDLVGAIKRHRQGHYRALVPLFSPYLPLGSAITRGWAYADLRVDRTDFRFITTHLEDGTNTISPIFLLVQALQEIELVSGPASPPKPVIIGADFNTVANDATSPTYLTYLFMLGNGFTDAWTAAGHSRFEGPTCCQEVLTIADPELTQRVDQIFTRYDISVTDTQRVGIPNVNGFVGYWPSDHAAVASQVQVGSLP